MNPAISLIPSTLLIAMSFVAGHIEPEPRNGVQPSAEPSVAIWDQNELSLLGSDIPPVVVERPTAGRIVVSGVTYARIEPYGRVVEGVPIALGWMGWSNAPNGTVAFEVDSGLDYTVHTAVYQYFPDGNLDYSIDGDLTTVSMPQTRQHRVQHWLELAIKIGQVEQDLGGRDSITWPEITQALAAIREEEQDNDAIPVPRAETTARDRDDDPARAGADAADDSGAEPECAGPSPDRESGPSDE